MMRTIRALLSTETTKLKHTATLRLSVIAPAVVLVLVVSVLLKQYFHNFHSRSWMPRPPADEWNRFLQGLWAPWALVVAPILISVEAAGLASLEHAGKHWKQLFALPIPRWSIFAIKMLICGLLTGASFLVFSVGSLGMGLLNSGLYGLHMASEIPWSLLLRVAGRAYLASWPAIAIQMWLSMRFSGFAIPIGTGLAATMATAAVTMFGLAGWWPWSMPGDSLPWGWEHVPAPAMISPVVCVLVAVLACWHLSRREIV
jgi:hypothetical protein